jgi:hypothetical protein
LLAQHPQFLGKAGLFREMKFAFDLAAWIGWHDVHCGALSGRM